MLYLFSQSLKCTSGFGVFLLLRLVGRTLLRIAVSHIRVQVGEKKIMPGTHLFFLSYTLYLLGVVLARQLCLCDQVTYREL